MDGLISGAIKVGNAQSGPLVTRWDGPRPQPQFYSPMKKRGALVLGMGGDTSNRGVGTFYEGAVAKVRVAVKL